MSSLDEIIADIKKTCIDFDNIDRCTMLSALSKQAKTKKRKADTEKDNILTNMVTKRVKTTTVSANIPLPWTGDIKTGYCLAIQENMGLFTQCNKKKANKTYETKDNWYCTRCSNTLKKSGAEKPKLGNVVDRQRLPIMEYVDSCDRKLKCIHYGNLLKKLKISIEDAKEQCTKECLVTSDELFKPMEV